MCPRRPPALFRIVTNNRDHFVNVARRRAAEAAQTSQGSGFFADQFENPANFNAHYQARLCPRTFPVRTHTWSS